MKKFLFIPLVLVLVSVLVFGGREGHHREGHRQGGHRQGHHREVRHQQVKQRSA